MSSLFDELINQADKQIAQVMMSVYEINGKCYQGTLDESPNLMGENYRDDYMVNGTIRTLTLFQSSGYKPRLGDQITKNETTYIVRGFSFNDGLIILQLE